jgi:hypothetical protein
MASEPQKLRRYLLGDLPKNESEDIDLQIIESDGFEDDVILSEEDLIEDYLDGSLSPREQLLFRNNFLTSTDRQDRVRELALLKEYARTSAQKHDLNFSSSLPKTNTNRGLNVFGLHLNLSYGLAFLVLVIVTSTGLWMLLRNTTSSAEQELAALNKQDLSELSKLQNVSNISLIPGTFRDSATPRKFIWASMTNDILVRLAIPDGNSPIYRADLTRNGLPVVSLEGIRLYRNTVGSEVRILFPRSVLSPGKYQIRLEDSANSNSAITYPFSVE